MSSSYRCVGIAFCLAALWNTASGASATQAATPRYELLVIPGLDSPGALSGAIRINDAGQVAGYVDGTRDDSYFLYDGRTTRRIPAGMPSSHVTLGLNDNGTVAGSVWRPGGGTYGFSYHDGVVSELGTLGVHGIYPSAINNAGRIVGHATFWETQPALLADGRLTVLGNFGGDWATADAINERGDIAGAVAHGQDTRAYVYRDGQFTELDTPAGTDASVYDIDDAGNVLGRYTDWHAGDSRVFVAGADGTVALPWQTDAIGPLAMNAHGDIISRAPDYEQLLWLDDTLYRLRDLLPGGAAEWTWLEAYDINDAGQLVGMACSSSGCEAVMFNPASPVPEPPHWALVLVGLPLVGLRLYRKTKRKSPLLAKRASGLADVLAPRPGLEPGTCGLTVRRSTD